MVERLDIGGAFASVFALYRQWFSTLVPVAAAFALVGGLSAAAFTSTLPGLLAGALQSLAIYFPATVFAGIVTRTVFGGRGDGAPRRPGSRRAPPSRPVHVPLILVGLIYGAGVAVGTLLIVVPGLYLLTIWAVSGPAVVVERLAPGPALRRSRSLVQNDGWQVLLALLLVAVVQTVGALGLISALGFAGSFASVLLAYVVVLTLTLPVDGLLRAIIYLELLRISEDAISPRAARAAEPDHGERPAPR